MQYGIPNNKAIKKRRSKFHTLHFSSVYVHHPFSTLCFHPHVRVIYFPIAVEQSRRSRARLFLNIYDNQLRHILRRFIYDHISWYGGVEKRLTLNHLAIKFSLRGLIVRTCSPKFLVVYVYPINSLLCFFFLQKGSARRSALFLRKIALKIDSMKSCVWRKFY